MGINTAFVGIGRSLQRRRALARKNMATLIGVPYERFSELFDWLNLFGEEGVNPELISAEEARKRALQLLPILGRYQRVILVGDQVARAFGFAKLPKYTWVPLNASGFPLLARMPHTSQINWNRRGPAYWEEAKAFAQQLLEPQN
jgi:hypothetical protein